MNHVWLVYDALVVASGLVVIALLVVVRGRRRFLGSFALFYAVFTACLLVSLSRAYMTLNLGTQSSLPVFLSYGVGTLLSYLSIVLALRFGQRALGLHRHRVTWAAATAMLLAAVLALPPPGVSFEATSDSYALRGPSFAASAIQLLVFAYALHLLWRAAWLDADRYDRLFFRGVLAFALIGFVESVFGFVTNWANPVGRLDAHAEEFLYSSIPYFLFSIFLSVYLSRLVGEAAEKVSAVRLGSPTPAHAPTPPVGQEWGLSERELQVLPLVLQGLNNKRIAAELGISLATVKTHLYNIFRKAKVGSRFELARRVEKGRGPTVETATPL